MSNRIVCLAIVFAVILSAPFTARAGWNQTGLGTFNYTNTANWDGGVIDDQFVTNLTANQTIQFSADRSVTNLTLAPYGTPVSQLYLYFQGSGGTRTLTLNGTTRFVPWVNVGVGGPIPQFQNTLNIALAGATPTLVQELTSGASSRLMMQGVISGSAGLTTAGRGYMELQANNTLSGPLNINQGQVRLSGANGALPNVTTINVAAGGQFELGNDTVNNNRLSDSAIINLNGGLSVGVESYGNGWYGNFMIHGDNALNNVTETNGMINLASGLSRVAARVYDTGTSYGNTTLTVGNLTRSAGAAVVFAGGMRTGGLYDGLGGYLNGGVGAQSYIKFTNPPSLTNGILPPYAVVGSDFLNNIFGNPISQDFYEFATYDSGKGVVGFSRVGTYVTNINAAVAGTNVLVTTDGETWTGARTMNSLNIRHTFAGSFNSATLTLESGGLMTRNVYGATTMGALNFNNQEAFVYHSGGHRLVLGGALSGIGAAGINFSCVAGHSGGSTGSDSPQIWLGQTITAPTRVLMGTLLLYSGDPLASSAVTVNQGGTLSLATSSTRTLGSLAGAGTVRLSVAETNAAGSTLVVGGDNTSTTFSGEIHAGQWVMGRIQNSSPSLNWGMFANPGVTGGNLIKTGTGSLTLSGMSTYNGTTTVRQGTLIAAGDVKATSVYGGGLDTLSGNVSFSSSALPGNLANGDRVIIQTVYGSGFSGFTPGQIYYVVNANGTTFQISNTPGGTAKTIANQSNVYWGKLDATKLVSSAGGDTLTLPSGWSLAVGDEVLFSSVPTLSALLPGIPYHVVDVSGSNFKVSAYAGGAPVRNLPSGSFGVVQPTVLGTGTGALVLGDASTGANTVSLLAGGAYTIGRDITVANQGNGTTIGGLTNTASYFTGTITLNKTANLAAATSGVVYFHQTGGGKFTGTGGLNIAGAGTVMICGTNDNSGVTTVKTGGTLGGTGTIGGGLTFETGGKLAVTLPANPNDYVPLKVNGAVDVSGAVAVVAPLTFAPSIGLTYTLISNDGADGVTGSFNPRSFALTYGGKEYYAAIMQGGDGNDVVLTFPPRGTVILIW